MKNCICCKNSNLIEINNFNSNILVSSDFKKIKNNIKFFICQFCGNLGKEINNKYKKKINTIYKKYQSFDTFNEIDQIKFEFTNKKKDLSKNRCEIIVEEISNILDKNNKIRYLDFGSGNGAMLSHFGMEFKNANLNAMDLNKSKLNRFKKIKNFKYFYNTEELSKTNKKFNVITLIHVLEHSLNPKKDLKLIRSKIEKNGLLIIQVPNINENPFDLTVFDHTSHFNSETLISLLKNSGFDIIKNSHKIIKSELTIICKKSIKKNIIVNIKNKNLNRLKIKHIKNIKYLNNYLKMIKNKKNKRIAIFGTAIAATWLAYNINNEFIFIDDNHYRHNKAYLNSKIYNTAEIIIKNNYDIFLPMPYNKIKFIKKKHKYDKFIYPTY